MKRILSFLLLFLPAIAQGETGTPQPSGYFYDKLMIVVILVFMLVLLMVAVVILKAVKVMEQVAFHPETIRKPEPEAPPMEYEDWKAFQRAKPSRWNKLLGLKPIEQESELQLEEDYDGIVELNNPTPAWFMILFYATIVFAVVYLAGYHIFGWGKLQDEEYTIEMAQAKTQQDLRLAQADNQVDESTVKETSDATVISEGKAVYATNCVPCHGDQGQGIVGPNLTDAFWLHGGKVGNLFKTIKYGIPEKGMISWENKLSPKQIAGVANYILSLKGTNPPNAKAPQGEKE